MTDDQGLAPRHLLETPEPTTRAALATGAPVWLHFNPIEYHGPHLSVRNDFLISRGLARGAHSRLLELFPTWGGPLEVTFDLGVGAVPHEGSVHVTQEVVRGTMLAVCAELVRLGARRVVLMTFHGDPGHNLLLQEGVRLLAERAVSAVAPMSFLMRHFVNPDIERLAPVFAEVENPTDRETLRRQSGIDFHAGFLETSLSLHYAPASVSPAYTSVPPCPEIGEERLRSVAAGLCRGLGLETAGHTLEAASRGAAWYALRPYPAYTGNPALASPAAGARLAELVEAEVAETVRGVFDGEIEAEDSFITWLGRLTLGGRLL